MKQTSLIPICNAIFNADTIVLSDGEKLLRFNNVFDDDVLQGLVGAMSSIVPGKAHGQEHRARQSWNLDVDVHNTMTAGDLDAIKLAVEEATGTKYQSMSVSLWEDTESYSVVKHVDPDHLNSVMQVYLPADNCALPNTGSIVYDGIQEYQVPFVPNTGYFLSNCNTTVHSSGEPVKAGHVRRSVCFYFRK